MAYFTTFGDLQRELTSYYKAKGQRLEFTEAVDELCRKGLLSEVPPSSEHNQKLFGHVQLGDFSKIVDSIVIPVTPSKGLKKRVDENDVIPLLRDVFIIRHSRYTRPYLHRHNYVELDYVVDGSCTLYFEEEKGKKLRAGELCIVAPYSNHDIEITDESTIYCIMLRRSTFEPQISFFPVTTFLEWSVQDCSDKECSNEQANIINRHFSRNKSNIARVFDDGSGSPCVV